MSFMWFPTAMGGVGVLLTVFALLELKVTVFQATCLCEGTGRLGVKVIADTTICVISLHKYIPVRFFLILCLIV